jgi:hypothetical protein
VTLHKPILMQPASGDADLAYAGNEMRALVTANYPFDGIVPQAAGMGCAVTQRGAGANFSVDVAAGMAVITGDDVALQNSYLCWNDATFNLGTPGAPASGTRLHRVVLQVQDKLNNGAWTGYTFTPVLVQDTGSGFPAEPASALTIAQVSIAAGQASVTNANITDMRAGTGMIHKWYTSTVSRSSTTRASDTLLQVIMPGNSTYYVEFGFSWTSASDKPNIGWDRPSGATGSWNASGTNQGGALGVNNWSGGWSELISPATQTSGPTRSGMFGNGIVINPSGNPQAWGPNWGSNAGASVVMGLGSFVRAVRIA